MTTLEFTEDGKILADGQQVGAISPDLPDWEGNCDWTAVLWRYPDTAPDLEVNDGKVAGLRYAGSRDLTCRRVAIRFSEGPWWTA